MLRNRLPYCPDCGSKMIYDAWDIITDHSEGGYLLEVIYPAWVCSTFCGYYEPILEEEDRMLG